MNNKNKRKEENPEILRENRQNNFDDDEIGMTLFPGAFPGSTVSSTESTGLIQVIPFTSEQLTAYDDVYSYRRTKPTAKKEKSGRLSYKTFGRRDFPPSEIIFAPNDIWTPIFGSRKLIQNIEPNRKK